MLRAQFTVTFWDAGLEVKILFVLLIGAALVALLAWPAPWILRRRPEVLGRLRRFLAAWRFGGPILALSGIAYLGMNFFVGVYAYPPVASYHAYAPGFAEMSMLLWAGLTAGGVTALGHAHLDRETA